MEELILSRYNGLSMEDRQELEDFLDNLNVKIRTLYEGLTKDKVLDILDLKEEDIPELLEEIRSYRIYQGYIVESIVFNESGLLILESSVKTEEDFMEEVVKLKTTGESLVKIGRLKKEDLTKLSGVVEYKNILYEDLTPSFLDGIMERNQVKLVEIFNLFRRMSLTKGYNTKRISLTEEGISLEQTPIKSEDEYLELVNSVKLKIK